MNQSSQSVASETPSQINGGRQPTNWLKAFWKFCRPHTIIGTSLSVLGIYLMTWAEREFGSPPLTLFQQASLLMSAWLACICGNIYIVGLNQIEDVEIDRVNKPHLPLASGEFSRREAVSIVSFMGVLALLVAWTQGPWLLATVGISLMIGTAYSLPPIRLKRFPFWASLCILAVRGVIVNLGLFLHYGQTLELRPGIPSVVWALTGFVLVFSFAIAIFKDIPDLEGDRRYNISTFTVRMGQQTIFNLARWVLTACYGGIILSAFALEGAQPFFMIFSHAIALAGFWLLSLRVNLSSHRPSQPQTHHDNLSSSPLQAESSYLSYANLYQFIWKLFFLEYLIFPAACWLAKI